MKVSKRHSPLCTSEEANDAYRFCFNFVVCGVEQKN